MTNDEIAAKSREIAETLEKAGISASAYGRGPVSKEVASINLDRGRIRIWPGLAEISIYPDKRKKQAVVDVVEKARRITRTYELSNYRSELSEEEWKQKAKYDFPVWLPNRRFISIELGPIQDDRFRNYRQIRSVTTIVSLSGTKQSFLVGVDEKANFICALPKRVTSVAEAHESLRPADVPADAPRQGEWFFVPASKKEQKVIYNYLQRFPRRFQIQSLEASWIPTHTAPMVMVNKQRYATGVVYDYRGSGRHEPLVLDGWYRVVRNLERAAPAGMSRTVTHWD